jgi:RHS repeat-associated protein
VEHRQYDSFGKIVRRTTGPVASAPTSEGVGIIFGYAGRPLEARTGLSDNRARWYEPGSGKFINEDPSGFKGGDANLYRYVGNDPLDQVDPSGLAARWSINTTAKDVSSLGSFGSSSYGLSSLTSTIAAPQQVSSGSRPMIVPLRQMMPTFERSSVERSSGSLAQAAYDYIVDRNGTPGAYNTIARFVLGGTPAWLGLKPAQNKIVYNANDTPTQRLISSRDFTAGNNALVRIIDEVNKKSYSNGEFYVGTENTSWKWDGLNFFTKGLLGRDPINVVTGGWNGNYTVNPDKSINATGKNTMGLESLTRHPKWGYNESGHPPHPTLWDNWKNDNIFQSVIGEKGQLRSFIVPFRSILPDNFFGENGPFRSVTQEINFTISNATNPTNPKTP